MYKSLPSVVSPAKEQVTRVTTGVGDGEGVGVGVSVGDGDGVGVGVSVGDGDGVGVSVGDGVGVEVSVGDGDNVAAFVGVPVGSGTVFGFWQPHRNNTPQNKISSFRSMSVLLFLFENNFNAGP